MLKMESSLPVPERVLHELACGLCGARDEARIYTRLCAALAEAVPSLGIAVVTWNESGMLTALEGGRLPDAPILLPGDLPRLQEEPVFTRASDDGSGAVLLAALDGETGVVHAAISIARHMGAQFSHAERDLVRQSSRLAGAAVEVARALEEAQQGEQRAERLQAINRELNATLDQDEVVGRVAAAAAELTGKPAVVWIAGEGTMRAAARAGGALIGIGEERPLSASATERLLRVAEAPPEALMQEEIRAIAREIAGPGRLLSPLVVGGRIVGLVAVGPWTDTQPEPEKMVLLHRIAPGAASAVENARLHAEVRSLSLTDPLVRLPNRRHLDLFLQTEFGAAQRGRPLCVVLFDLDRFKDYNDTHGHYAGDQALLRFAAILTHGTRSMNLAARYGGEEFVAVLSQSTPDGAYIYADRIRAAVENEFEGKLTVSAGLAGYDDAYATPADMISAADAALYRAKQAGRNRVETVG